MEILVPLAVAVPLIAAAGLTAFAHFLPGRVGDVLALGVASFDAVVSVLLIVRSSSNPIVYWFGGWQPRHGLALGIGFTVDPLGAGMAALAGALVTAVLLFSWRYFDEVGTLFHVLVLVFLSAMTGFALSGDLFNMFVWFELMSVAAYALTGYRCEEATPLEGALNFGITNSVGAFLILAGTGLLYGHTGALNLAQMGRSLANERPHGLLVVAFTFLVAGFFAKAAAVPFHFWHADAHAVAPNPICALFSGVMVQLGLYAVARVYWTTFSGALAPHVHAVRGVLVAVGILTAIVGAVMCFLQRHLKRMLAYSTISEGGLMLVGVALLGAKGLAGTAAYVLAHGLTKAGLFLCVGILLYRLSSVDELRLCGRGRRLIPTGVIFTLGALAMTGVPPLGTFLGRSLIEESASKLGYGWVPAVMTVVSIVSVGAILRAAARVFLGWGEARDPLLSPEPDESREVEHEPRKRPAVMLVPAAALVVAALGLSLVPGLEQGLEQQAARFQDRAAYAQTVFAQQPSAVHAPPLGSALPTFTASSVAYGVASAAGAVLVALLGLYRPRLARRLPSGPLRAVSVSIGPLRAAHSGLVTDYVTWVVVGTAALGGIFAVTLAP